jgi:dolichyl-diphosphooligosaccharide--protein glycosyltransferase/undecaprenyl-diphosphooligosaccharide--protein glycosyltransferase
LQTNNENKTAFFLILIAFAFGVFFRLIWVFKFGNEPSFLFNGSLMLTTNDGYFFASGVDKLLHGNHDLNPRLWDMYAQGIIWVSAAIAFVSPFSLDTTLFYMPIFISSLIVIPLILIGKLYGRLMWGFVSALIAVIAWSYYNRTMAGYYDTDMFAIWLPVLALYFMLRSLEDSSWEMLFFASLTLVFYSFVYSSSAAVIYSLSLTYIGYKLLFYAKEEFTYKAMVLLLLGIIPFGSLVSAYNLPYGYALQAVLLFVVYKVFSKKHFSQISLIAVSIALFLALLYFGNIFNIMVGKITGYTSTSSIEGLKFYGVVQTVQEANPIDPVTMANRISGWVIGFLISIIGYLLLVKKHRALVIALPLLGIGIFSLIGGLRFTVYATPIAALGAGYAIIYTAELIRSKIAQKLFIALSAAVLLFPNIVHLYEYDMPTVFTNGEVEDLTKLKEISKDGDYVLSWWDYGYPLWYYTGRNTLIDGGKHHHDNFVISQIMLSPSSTFVYNMSSLAVEEYIKFAQIVRDANKNDKATPQSAMYKELGYQDAIDVILKNRQKDQLEPFDVLSHLEENNIKLPQKTTDIYIYMPYRMIDIFPTIASFGKQNLKTGENANDMQLTSTSLAKQEDNVLTLNNGFIVDINNGTISSQNQAFPLKDFVEINKDGVFAKQFDPEGQYCVVYKSDSQTFYIMDSSTYGSAYIQMFLLGKYDKNLFEPVVSSPYSKIYKLKR